MSESEDLYALLGASPAASPTELAQAYAGRVAASATDPALLLRLTQAFQVLGDPARRAEYDSSRAIAPAATVPPADVAPVPVAPPTGPSVTVPPGQFPPVPAVPSGASPAPADRTTLVESGAAPAGGLSDRTEIVGSSWGTTAGPEDITHPSLPVTCPVCGASNPPGSTDTYCADCGFLLTQAPGEGQAAPTSGVRLVSSDGAREFTLRPGTNTVGRQDADVLIPDSTVSRLHARLQLEGDRVTVEDVNSTNGTRVNASRIEPGRATPVGEGDEIQFGNVLLRVRGAAPGAAPGSTLVERGPAPAEPVDRGPELARLVALPGGTVYTLHGFPATVGRRGDNAVVINDPYVSGRHAEIVQSGDGYEVRDLGSTNGTMVGSEPLERGESAPLEPGGIVQFGKQRFRFVVPEAEMPAPEETAAETPETIPEPAAPIEATAEPAAESAPAAGVEPGAGAKVEEQAEGRVEDRPSEK